MKPDYKRSPCIKCVNRNCADGPCSKYRRWFLRAWKKFNAYAWTVMDNRGKNKPFQYGLPHEDIMAFGPCETCPCKVWCEKPCSLRLRWWDVSMAKLRKALQISGSSRKAK